jgi:FixJ family two-component response regulator
VLARETMREPTVYVVDDDLDMRDSLRWLLETVGSRVETYASAHEFLRDYSSDRIGCLVFDVRMPGMSGLDLFAELARRGEAMPVIFITAFADVPMAIRAMKSGAVEFVEKPFNRQTLLEKIQRAIRQDVERHRLRADREAIRARFLSLTDKEREVLEAVKQGEPNKAIAARTQISIRAVEMRRASLMKKLGVRSMMELMRLTIEHEADSTARRDVS